MTNFFVTIFLLLPVLLSAQSKNYQYQNSIPTKNGIQYYIDINIKKIVKQVQDYIGDTIYSYNIRVDDLSLYSDYDSLEAGRFYPDDEILITNELKFLDYELEFVPKWKQKQYSNNNKFVKAVVVHELVHLYIYQFVVENNEIIFPDYLNFSTMRTNGFGSTFVEEGLCEYVVGKMNQSICDNSYVPTSIDEIRDAKNRQKILYIYSPTFIRPYADKMSFRQLLINILGSKPPSYEELLKPMLYYERLSNR